MGLFSQQDSQMRPAPGFIKRNELANMDRMARQVRLPPSRLSCHVTSPGLSQEANDSPARPAPTAV